MSIGISLRNKHLNDSNTCDTNRHPPKNSVHLWRSTLLFRRQQSWRCSLHSWLFSYTFMSSSCVFKLSLFFFLFVPKNKEFWRHCIVLDFPVSSETGMKFHEMNPLYYLCCLFLCPSFFVPLDRLFLVCVAPNYLLFIYYLFIALHEKTKETFVLHLPPASHSRQKLQTDTHDITKRSLHKFNPSSGSNTDTQHSLTQT